MLAIVADRRGEAYLTFMRAALVLAAFILVAAAIYAGSFDLGEHPLQIVYPLAYVVALIGAIGALRWERRQEAGALRDRRFAPRRPTCP
ncbi:MAG: hypothetical protein ACRD2W_14490 [Acidimicrobiales bacterium]